MAGACRALVACPDELQVAYVQSLAPDSDGNTALSEADVVAVQRSDVRTKAPIDNLRADVRYLEFPTVSGAFLWPFGNQGHPNNTVISADFPGPYHAQLGDAFLNRLISAEVAVNEAVERYLRLDMNAEVDLSRLFEVHMERQRALDQMTGFELAGLIETNFRDEQIFRTPGRPNLRIFSALFSQFCAELGIKQQQVQQAAASLVDSPFPRDEMPIHPSVIRHFGLRYVNESTRYQYSDEGSFTFTEYCTRYMRFEYNDALRQGIALSRSGATDQAIDALQIGLQKSPHSAEGHHALSVALERQGRLEESIGSMRRALDIDGRDVRFHVQLGHLLLQRGDLPSAESVLTRAIADGLVAARLHDLLANVYLRQGRTADGIDALRRAIGLDGSNPHIRAYYAGQVLRQGDVAEAEHHIRTSIELDPDVAVFHAILGRILTAKGDLDHAVQALQTATDLNPSDVLLLVDLCHLFLKQARVAEAILPLQRVIELDPQNPHPRAHLGNLLAQQGRLDDAERSLRHAISLAPDQAAFHLALSRLLLRLDRRDDALASAATAAGLAPGDQQYARFLADLTAKAGSVAAQSEMRDDGGGSSKSAVPARTIADEGQKLNERRSAFWTSLVIAGERSPASPDCRLH